MKGVFLGCTKFSEEILKELIKIQTFEVQAIFSIPEYFDISYSEEKVKISNYCDLKKYAEELKVPYFLINSSEGSRITDHIDIIKKLETDVILVMGWYYMVPDKIRKLAKFGAWGLHASLLPKYAGGAPLVWAIINGEKKTGVSLFKLDNGVDNGDLIKQIQFSIDENDNIKTIYQKATKASKKIVKDTLSKPENLLFTPQDQSKIEVWPQRSPSDGEIDWELSPKQIKDFIRAQTKPYPGAWTIINEKKITIWDADIELK